MFFSNKSFKIALVVSVASHSVLFFPFHNFSLINKNKDVNPIEVTYLSASPKSIKKTVSAFTKPASATHKVIKQVSIAQPVPEKMAKQTVTINEKVPSQELTKKPEVKSAVDEKIKKSKKYFDYYHLLKAKIRNYVNYPASLSQGEIHLSFTLASSGQLKIIKINEEPSSSDTFLRTAALDSIKKANPFPPFPANFSQDEATFNVIISFEIK